MTPASLRTLVEFWRAEGQYGDVAEKVGDDVTGEYARSANRTADAIESLLTELAEAKARVGELEVALGNLLPSKLCGESWNLPDRETVSITVTFGSLASARSALGGGS